MIKRSVCLVFIFISLCSAAAAQEWKEQKSEHFIVYYLDDDNFASEASQWAEKYYVNIASDLGYSRYDNFWTWDKRVKIYIYRDRAQFLSSTGAKDWSYGFVNYNEKTIYSYANNARFLDALLPHELAHLVFRDFVGFKGEVPMWLDEGVAQWEEADKRRVAIELAKEFIAKREFIALSRLTQMNIAEESDAEVSRKFYAEAASLVGFMIKKYGESKFIVFCQQLRDGASMNAALSFAYSADPIRDIGELEKEWIKYYGGE